MTERDELAAVIDAAVPHDAVPSFRFTHAVKAADAALRAGYGKAPAASEGVTEQAAQVLCAEEVCSTWEADDGTVCCNGQCKTIADRLASADLLASHPVTDETVERVARAMWHDEACRYHDEPLENWSKVFPEAKGDWVRLARAAIEALGGQR